MLDHENQLMLVNGMLHHAAVAAAQVHACAADVAQQQMRPSAIYRPALSLDGNQWCALYGANLMEGVAGFGDSPAAAMQEFDKAWGAPTKKEPQ